MPQKELWIGLAVAGTFGVLIVGGVALAFRKAPTVPTVQKHAAPLSPSSSNRPLPDRATLASDQTQEQPMRGIDLDTEFDQTLDEARRRAPNLELQADLGGRGKRRTKTFDVWGNDKVLIWAVDADADSRFLSIDVKDEMGRLVAHTMPITLGRFGGTEAIEIPQGHYYLDVAAAAKWRVAILEVREYTNLR